MLLATNEASSVNVGAEYWLTTTCLESQQQVSPGPEYPCEFDEGVSEILRRRVDDRVPTHDTGERRLRDREVIQLPLLEVDVGMGDPCGSEHRGRRIQPDDFDVMSHEKGGHTAGSATDIGNAC